MWARLTKIACCGICHAQRCSFEIFVSTVHAAPPVCTSWRVMSSRSHASACMTIVESGRAPKSGPLRRAYQWKHHGGSRRDRARGRVAPTPGRPPFSSRNSIRPLAGSLCECRGRTALACNVLSFRVYRLAKSDAFAGPFPPDKSKRRVCSYYPVQTKSGRQPNLICGLLNLQRAGLIDLTDGPLDEPLVPHRFPQSTRHQRSQEPCE